MTEEISGVIFGVWFLIGAALVFWMQAGFAMVEAGFTRAKNTGIRTKPLLCWRSASLLCHWDVCSGKTERCV